MPHRWLVVMGVTAALVLAATSSTRAELVKHSGIVRAVDRQAGTVTLDETGRWIAWQGMVVVATHEIGLTPATTVTTLSREASVRGGSPGGYVERPADVSALAAGDVVAVVCVHEDKRLTAVSITVLRLREPPPDVSAP